MTVSRGTKMIYFTVMIYIYRYKNQINSSYNNFSNKCIVVATRTCVCCVLRGVVCKLRLHWPVFGNWYFACLVVAEMHLEFIYSIFFIDQTASLLIHFFLSVTKFPDL